MATITTHHKQRYCKNLPLTTLLPNLPRSTLPPTPSNQQQREGGEEEQQKQEEQEHKSKNKNKHKNKNKRKRIIVTNNNAPGFIAAV